jgi:hypothetical protein
LPPYKVTDGKWCLEGDNLKITGHLKSKILGTPVPNERIQIKIFEEGGNEPIKEETYKSSDEDGNFEVTYPPPFPEDGKGYIINTAYKYDKIYKKGQWEIKDFYVFNPKVCQ